MDELIDRIVLKTGLPRNQAMQAANVTIDWLKSKLPASMSSQIEGAIAGAKASEVAGKIERGLS